MRHEPPKRCERRTTDFPWLVGGNDETNLPPVNPDTGSYILGILETDDRPQAGIDVQTNGCNRIQINGTIDPASIDDPEYAEPLSGRVIVRNGVVETIDVPVDYTQMRTAGGDLQFLDFYFEVPSNAYIIDLDEGDITTVATEVGITPAVVNINNIFLGYEPVSYPPNLLTYPTNFVVTPPPASIAPNPPLPINQFVYTLRINNNDTINPLPIMFTPESYDRKFVYTDVTFTVGPYVIPPGGYMMAFFRVVRDVIPGMNGETDCRNNSTLGNTRHTMISNVIYPAPLLV